MSHPSDVTLSMHADSALAAQERASIDSHIASCGLCSQKLAGLEQEARLIAAAFEAEAKLHSEVTGGEPAQDIPAFSRPAGLREFALLILLTALLVGLVRFLWKTLFGELVVNAIQIAASTYIPTAYELMSTSITYYIQKGTAMFSAYLGYVSLAVFIFALFWWVGRSVRAQSVAGLLACALLAGASVTSEPVSALETRYDKGHLVVDANETIDDTLLVAAETVLVKGNVTGDLMVSGQRVEVNGAVGGNIIAFAETVTLRGSVGGTIISAGNRVELRAAIAKGDLWAAGEQVVLDAASKVLGNATAAGEQVLVNGAVSKDLTAFGDTIELSGSLGGDLAAYADNVRLLEGARVAGDARLHLDSEEQLTQESGVQVDGQVEFLSVPERLEPENRYTEPEFYLWQLARLLSAVLVGLALLWLFPEWRRVSVAGGGEGLKTAGMGLLAMLALPVVAVLVGATVVGLPFAFLAAVTWVVILYLAKILVGVFLGRSLLEQTERADNLLLIVLVGIALVILLVNLPWIGGLINLIITLVGAGLVVQRLLRALTHRQSL